MPAQPDIAGRIELKLEPPRELLNCYLPHYRIQRPKVGLALSGGGARGLAHIGILKALEQAGIQVDMIAGTSMGSIVGGLYAAGYSADQLQRLAEQVDWSDLFVDTPSRSDLFLGQKQEKAKHIFQVRFAGFKPYFPRAYTAGQKLSSFLTSLTLEADYKIGGDFDRLPIPFRTVTTDLVSGKKVVLASGDLGEALRASLTIPLLFTPVERDSQLLADGGIVDYLPVDVVRDMGADIVIAVNILNSLHPKEGLQAPWQIADQVISIIMMISNERQIPEADVLIDPDLRGHSSLDFSNIPQLIQWGKEAAEARMEQIRRVIEERSAPGDDHRFVVSSLEVEGLNSVDKSTLIDVISTQEGDTCGLLGLRRDLERIYNLGHFQTVCATMKTDSTHSEPATVSVCFHVEENPILRKISLKGNSVFPADTILARIQSVPGMPIDCRTSEVDIRAILDLYHSNGYVLARIEEIQFDRKMGNVLIVIDEGRVADIQIHGDYRTRKHVIQREFPLRRGRIFNLDQANRGVKNIFSTGLFDRVDLRIQRSDSATIVGLDVEEKKYDIIRVGARYDREYMTEEFIELLDDNLFGHGAKLNLHLQYGERRQQYELRYRADRFLKTYLTYGGRAYYQKRKQYLYGPGESKPLAYQERRWGGRLAIGQQMYRFGTVSVEGRAEEVKLEADEEDQGSLGRDQIRSITVRSVVDNLDRYPFPLSGNYSHLFLEAAADVFGGTATYLKFFGTFESYVTVLKRHTLHPQVSFGSMDQITPFSERFKVGGNRTFCDYPGEEYAIRLYGYHDEELAGRQLLWANLEYRYKTPWIRRLDLYLSGRYDIGYLWQEAEAFRSDQIRQAWGAGIALDTPVGPAEFSYGRFKAGDNRLYFSFGYWF